MRELISAKNVSLDRHIAAPGDDLGWSVPSDELFPWWSDRVGATGLALYGRGLWEGTSSHWPTADQQPGATPAEIEFARRWRDMPEVVLSSTTSTVDWNTRLVTGDAVTEITRVKAEDGGPIDIGGAVLAATAMRAGLIDEYVLVTAPVLVGGGTLSARRRIGAGFGPPTRVAIRSGGGDELHHPRSMGGCRPSRLRPGRSRS